LIIDNDDNVCGIDEEGELCIRSSTLTRGYWNRPDLNETVYLYRDGHGAFPDVYFRTGDWVVRRSDGLLRFLGRKDRMVKTRGHRVELDEVEAALASHANVSEAAAFAVPDGQGSMSILAAAMLSGTAEEGSGDLLQHMRSKLPGYALPQKIFIVDGFPRTSSGKIDRRQIINQYVDSKTS
jgi:acyl-coenzyme A synthetase/AMP-(fatty) acid ligase